MKTILLMSLFSLITVLGCCVVTPSESGPKKGTRPGDIGKSADIEAAAKKRGHRLAAFGAGCFWGVEQEFRKMPGVTATCVGYTGGRKLSPTYKEVCSDSTGHAEAVLIEYDPNKISYTKLLETFWKLHDPTTKNRQGPDYGSQYRSAVFTFDDEQMEFARSSKDKEQKDPLIPGQIVTEIVPSTTFWPAEEYHQQYVEKGGVASCHIRKKD